MSIPGFPALSEALEATHLNVDVEDPKLHHGNCVYVIANKVEDGSLISCRTIRPDLGWDSQPVHDFFRHALRLTTLRNEPGVIIHPEWTQVLLLRRKVYK